MPLSNYNFEMIEMYLRLLLNGKRLCELFLGSAS